MQEKYSQTGGGKSFFAEKGNFLLKSIFLSDIIISPQCIAQRRSTGIGAAGFADTSPAICPGSLPSIRAGGGEKMKRVKAACILQTLVFSQKEDSGLSREQMLNVNRMELKRYIQSLERTHTRYQLVSQEELENGAIVVHVRKQYNDRADVSEYFN